MTTIEFMDLFASNIWSYFIIAVIVLFVFIKFINRLAFSWFNPFKYIIFQFAIGISVACFLYYCNYTDTAPFCFVIVSTCLFGVVLWKKYPRTIGISKISIKNETAVRRPFFVLCYFIYIGSTLLTYALRGIPIFNDDSRLTTFTGAGGLGVIERFSPFMMCYSLFYIYNLFSLHRISKYKLILLILPFVIFGVLSGSRSSFMAYIFAFWGYRLFYRNEEIQLSNYKKLLIPIIFVTLFTFAFEHATNLSGAIIPMFSRILACGDLYWYALPGNVWENISIKAPFADVTVGLLAPLRIIDENRADMPIGFQLTRLVYVGFDQSTGPVELFPISSLVFFGYMGGLLFTVFQAFFVSKLSKMFFKRSTSLIISSFLYYSFWKCLYFLGSFRDGMGQLFGILVSLFILVFFVILVSGKIIIKR